ncbi:MAG: ABC transporter permease [Thermoanaerobaculia bacterium]|nr:ABC transporter permease [Thermoanaerobaculia bacterium]
MMSTVLAMAAKDLRLLVRDRGGLFFTLAFPFLVAIFFGSIFSGGSGEPRQLQILVVDEDGSEGSSLFVESLDRSEALSVELSSRVEAVEQVRRGKSVAYVALLPGFGASLSHPFAGSPPRAELGVDPARGAEAGILQGLLTQFAAERLQDAFGDPSGLQENARSGLQAIELSGATGPQAEGLKRLLTEVDRFATTQDTADGQEPRSGGQGGGFKLEPIRIEKASIIVAKNGPPNAYAISFPQGILWGILGCTAAFGLSLVSERTSGTLVRLQSAPIGRGQILLGKALACFFACSVVSVALVIFGTLAFGLAPSSWGKVAVAIACAAMAFSGIMMFLATLGKTERAVSGVAWASLLIMAMLGGGMIPLFVMPGWMQTLSNISPVKWSILAMEGALWRGFGWDEMLLPCVVLLLVGSVGLLLGTKLFRWPNA